MASPLSNASSEPLPSGQFSCRRRPARARHNETQCRPPSTKRWNSRPGSNFSPRGQLIFQFLQPFHSEHERSRYPDEFSVHSRGCSIAHFTAQVDIFSSDEEPFPNLFPDKSDKNACTFSLLVASSIGYLMMTIAQIEANSNFSSRQKQLDLFALQKACLLQSAKGNLAVDRSQILSTKSAGELLLHAREKSQSS